MAVIGIIITMINQLNQEQNNYIKKHSSWAFFSPFLWPFGARLYIWGIIQLILFLLIISFPILLYTNAGISLFFQYPLLVFLLLSIVGGLEFISLIIFIYGRRLSWKKGKWKSFEEFQKRLIILDKITIVFIIILAIIFSSFIYYNKVGFFKESNVIKKEFYINKFSTPQANDFLSFEKGFILGQFEGKNIDKLYNLPIDELKNSKGNISFHDGYMAGFHNSCTENGVRTDIEQKCVRIWIERLQEAGLVTD